MAIPGKHQKIIFKGIFFCTIHIHSEISYNIYQLHTFLNEATPSAASPTLFKLSITWRKICMLGLGRWYKFQVLQHMNHEVYIHVLYLHRKVRTSHFRRGGTHYYAHYSSCARGFRSEMIVIVVYCRKTEYWLKIGEKLLFSNANPGS